MDPIKAIEDALAAPDLPPGPWSWWTSCSFRRLSSDPTGKDGDVLYAVVHRDGVGDIQASEGTKAYIAACHPEAISSLLDRLREAEADARRYRWLRDNTVQELEFDHTAHTCDIGILVPCKWDEDPQLDDAIDAAMKETP